MKLPLAERSRKLGGSVVAMLVVAVLHGCVGHSVATEVSLPQRFEDVWYRPTVDKHGLLVYTDSVKVAVEEEFVEFVGAKESMRLPYVRIRRLAYGSVGWDLFNKWATVEYEGDGGLKYALFSGGKALGWGGIGSAEAIFASIRSALKKKGITSVVIEEQSRSRIVSQSAGDGIMKADWFAFLLANMKMLPRRGGAAFDKWVHLPHATPQQIFGRQTSSIATEQLMNVRWRLAGPAIVVVGAVVFSVIQLTRRSRGKNLEGEDAQILCLTAPDERSGWNDEELMASNGPQGIEVEVSWDRLNQSDEFILLPAKIVNRSKEGVWIDSTPFAEVVSRLDSEEAPGAVGSQDGRWLNCTASSCGNSPVRLSRLEVGDSAETWVSMSAAATRRGFRRVRVGVRFYQHVVKGKTIPLMPSDSFWTWSNPGDVQ